MWWIGKLKLAKEERVSISAFGARVESSLRDRWILPTALFQAVLKTPMAKLLTKAILHIWRSLRSICEQRTIIFADSYSTRSTHAYREGISAGSLPDLLAKWSHDIFFVNKISRQLAWFLFPHRFLIRNHSCNGLSSFCYGDLFTSLSNFFDNPKRMRFKFADRHAFHNNKYSHFKWSSQKSAGNDEVCGAASASKAGKCQTPAANSLPPKLVIFRLSSEGTSVFPFTDPEPRPVP
jgi:hypothetical protein